MGVVSVSSCPMNSAPMESIFCCGRQRRRTSCRIRSAVNLFLRRHSSPSAVWGQQSAALAALPFGGRRRNRHRHFGVLDLSANSWMNTPVVHEFRDGVAYQIDWYAIVFNPSFIYRLGHMLNAPLPHGRIVVLAVGALSNCRCHMDHYHASDGHRLTRRACAAATLLGDLHGLNTRISLELRPWKRTGFATTRRFSHFAWPDETAELNRSPSRSTWRFPHADLIGRPLRVARTFQRIRDRR